MNSKSLVGNKSDLLLEVGSSLDHESHRRTYRKNPKNSDTPKIAVIILKLEQYRFATE